MGKIFVRIRSPKKAIAIAVKRPEKIDARETTAITRKRL
jgi:hypothetical protein